MEQPLVSIIIPVFNAADFVDACLDSVLKQSWQHLEIILVDDGSSDQTPQICRDYALRDPRITLVHQPNHGVSAARNVGIDLANGPYITFVDADDWLDPHHIECLATALQGTNASCAVCGYKIEYPHHTEMRCFGGPRVLSGPSAQETMLLPDQFQGFLCNKMFVSAVIRSERLKLHTDLTHFEDLVFCGEYFANCQSVCIVPQATYHYRQHTASAMRQSPHSCSAKPSSVTALERAIHFCVSARAKQLCRARIQMEYAHILRHLLSSCPNHPDSTPLLKRIRSGIGPVLLAPLKLTYKLKFLSTAIFPRTAARFWTARENRVFHSP